MLTDSYLPRCFENFPKKSYREKTHRKVLCFIFQDPWFVCLYACLLVMSVSSAKRDGPIELPFGVTDRTQQVSYCGRLSPIQCVLFGVPQESVLGPLLYVLYTA